MLLMRDEHADDSDNEVAAGELRHEETGEVYSIVYEGQGKKFKVTGACATCIWKAPTQLAACMILYSCGSPRAADNLPVLRGDAGVRGRTARPNNDAYDGV